MLEHFPKVPSYLQCACCIVATSTSRNLIFWSGSMAKLYMAWKSLVARSFWHWSRQYRGQKNTYTYCVYLHQILEACHTQELQQRAHSPLQRWFLSHDRKLRQPFRRYCPLRFVLFQFLHVDLGKEVLLCPENPLAKMNRRWFCPGFALGLGLSCSFSFFIKFHQKKWHHLHCPNVFTCGSINQNVQTWTDS